MIIVFFWYPLSIIRLQRDFLDLTKLIFIHWVKDTQQSEQNLAKKNYL